MFFNTFQYSSTNVKSCISKVLSSRLCVGSQGELAPWLELAPPSCLEQSDKLNATPPILLYPPCFFYHYFLCWKPPLSRPALTHNRYKGPPVSARAQMDFPKFPNGFLGRPIVISSPQFSWPRFLALRQDGALWFAAGGRGMVSSVRLFPVRE